MGWSLGLVERGLVSAGWSLEEFAALVVKCGWLGVPPGVIADRVGLPVGLVEFLFLRDRRFRGLLDGELARSVWSAEVRREALGGVVGRVLAGGDRLDHTVRAMEYLDERAGVVVEDDRFASVEVVVANDPEVKSVSVGGFSLRFGSEPSNREAVAVEATESRLLGRSSESAGVGVVGGGEEVITLGVGSEEHDE